jgi:hypothetical protein
MFCSGGVSLIVKVGVNRMMKSILEETSLRGFSALLLTEYNVSIGVE